MKLLVKINYLRYLDQEALSKYAGIGMYIDRELSDQEHKLVTLTSVLDLENSTCVANLPIL